MMDDKPKRGVEAGRRTPEALRMLGILIVMLILATLLVVITSFVQPAPDAPLPADTVFDEPQRAQELAPLRALRSDGQELALLEASGDAWTLRLYPPGQPDNARSFALPPGLPQRLHYSADGTRLLLMADDDIAHVLDATNGALRLTVPNVYAIDDHPDGLRYAIARLAPDGPEVLLVDDALQPTVLRFSVANLPQALAFNESGTLLATLEGTTVRLFNIAQGDAQIWPLEDMTPLPRILFNAASDRMAVLLADGQIAHWRIPMPGVIPPDPTLYEMQLQPAAEHLALDAIFQGEDLLILDAVGELHPLTLGGE